MNKLALGGYGAAKVPPSLLVLVAAGLGISVAYQPLFTALAVVGIAVVLLTVQSPHWGGYLLLAASAVSVQYLFDVHVLGMDLLSLQKFFILLLCLPAALKYGVYGKKAAPVVALAVMLAFTYLLADRPPSLGAFEPIKAFIGLSSPFVMMLIRWPKPVAAKLVDLICFLPLISVFVGFALDTVGFYSLFLTEFTGAVRLEGANIPPHLAFLAFMAFMVSIIEAKRRPDRLVFHYSMMSINFLILLLTGTRGALISCLLMVFLFLYDLVKQYLKGKTALLIPLIGFVAVLGTSVWLQLDNLKKRSFERTTGAGIDLSGRLEAWTYFLKGAEGSPWFGKGLGAVLVANDGSIFEGFTVPHNEYIRFYYDGGLIGAIILFAALFFLFSVVIRETAKGLRIYIAVLIIGFLIYSLSDNTLSTLQFILPFCIYLNATGALSNSDKEKFA
ncbi:O-antigen ligase family protein [Cohnella thailandensis]|uniref:O-antigen ligase family protein n=1 Tax=Cohnella thailandensis TaxID=557557 RepID=A0A841SY79_9BACL|nr:O-antigen ligase family protein [Cohnella thailandensis]MBB6635128.1 O-antigen ligase family protein [Cohnella thailandensis]MBP1974406.1 O-antigen ligase [Cohnella thailandensis]